MSGLDATGDTLQSVAKALNQIFNDTDDPKESTTGFCLLVFGTGGPGIANYVSNCSRDDMIEVLRSAADRLENNEDKRRY